MTDEEIKRLKLLKESLVIVINNIEDITKKGTQLLSMYNEYRNLYLEIQKEIDFLEGREKPNIVA